MTKRIFTFLVAFLATVGNAVWGQTTYTVGENTGDKLEINQKNANIEISMASGYKKSNDQIIIAKDLGEITITLKNVDIDVRLGGDTKTTDTSDPEVDKSNAGNCAMEINSGTIVTLIWKGANKLWSSSQRAGINVKPGATLILKGPDTENNSLEAGSLCNGSASNITHGAGIGGDGQDPDFGTIIIESGKVTAISQAKENAADEDFSIYAAGIGGGYGSDNSTSTEGTIIIKGGTVVASNEHYTPGSTTPTTNKSNGAGIGGGNGGTCTNITITGGTVNAQSQNGDKIGNGKDYTGTTKPDVIIAPESGEKDVAPNVTGEVGTNVDKLVVKNDKTTLSGEVEIPAGTQVYAPDIQKTNDSDKILGYNIKLTNEEKISGEAEDGDSGDHSIKNFPETQSDIYYGASESETNKTRVSIPVNVSCSWGHHFMGWYSLKENSIDEYEIKEAASEIEIPTEEPTDTEVLYKGAAVWVDDYLDIVVANLHEWKQDDASTNPPTISVIPKDAASLLTFALNKGTKAGNRLDDVRLYNDNSNIFIGTPTIVYPTESYADLDDVTVSVKVTNSTNEAKTIKTPIFIHSGNLVVTGVEVVTPHTYTGLAHNNKEDDASHAFKFTVKVEGDDIDLPADFTLTEGVHYVVESYTLTVGGTALSETPAKVEGSAQIIDAGTYSNIKLKAVTDTEPDREEYSIKFKIGENAKASDEYTIPTELVVNPKDLTLKAKTESIEISNGTDPNFTANWDDYVSVDGIVTINGTKDEVTPTVTASVTPTATGNWWEVPGNYAVTFTLSKLSGDDASNYSKENTTTVVRNIIVKGSAENVDIKPGTDSPWNMAGDGTFSHVYDGTVPEIGTLAITVAGVEEPVILTEGEDFTVDNDDVEKDVKEGGYTATITFKKNDYITTDATKDVTLYITARPLNITFKDKVASIDGLTVADLVVPDNLVSGETPTYKGTITSEETGENTYKVTITGFKIENSTTFTSTNYAIKVKGTDYDPDGDPIVIDEVTVDPDYDGGDGNIDRIDYCNIYEDEVCEGVTVEFSRDVVREGQSVLVTVKVDEEFDATKMTLKFKRGLFGYWEDLTLTPTENPNEYIIKNIYTDIYVRAEGAVPTGIESIDGAKVYTKDGSLFVQTPQQEQVRIISITGAIVKNEQQVGLKQYTGLQRGVYVVMVGDQVFKVRI